MRQTNERLMETFFEGVNSHDPDLLVSVLAENCEINDEGAPYPYDRAGLHEMHSAFYEHFPDATFEILHRIVEENGACYVYRATGTGRGEWPEGNDIEGARMDLVEVLVSRVSDGAIVGLDFHMDTEILKRQVWRD